MYKLFERKARCLKALKEYPRALESMKSAEMWMKYSTLNETKSSSFKKDVAKQIEFLDEKVAAMSISEFKNTCDVRKNAAGIRTHVNNVMDHSRWTSHNGFKIAREY